MHVALSVRPLESHLGLQNNQPEHRGEDFIRGQRLDAVAVEPEVFELLESPERCPVDGPETAAAEVEADEVGRVLEGGGGQLGDGVGAQREAHQVATVGRGEAGHVAKGVGRQVQLYQVRQTPARTTPLFLQIR